MVSHQRPTTLPLAPIMVAMLAIVAFNISESIPLREKRAFSYIANETACTVDHIVYREGDPIPTDDPCETCRCRPPGFSCVLRECEIKTGCRAIRRIGECCPLYQCGCEHNGKYYHDGERIQNAESPCYSCYCQGSSITCSLADCKFRFDCEPEYIIGECCPRYDHCLPELSAADFVTVKSTELPMMATTILAFANHSASNSPPTTASNSATSTVSPVTDDLTAATSIPPIATTTTHQNELISYPATNFTPIQSNDNKNRSGISIELMFTELPILLFTNETANDRTLPEAIETPATESAITTNRNLFAWTTDNGNLTSIGLTTIDNLDSYYTTTMQSVVSIDSDEKVDLSTETNLPEKIDNFTKSIESSTLAPILDYQTTLATKLVTDLPQQSDNTQTEYSQDFGAVTPEIESESQTINSDNILSLSNGYFNTNNDSQLNKEGDLETTTPTPTISLESTKDYAESTTSTPLDVFTNNSQLFFFSLSEATESSTLKSIDDVSSDETLLVTTPMSVNSSIDSNNTSTILPNDNTEDSLSAKQFITINDLERSDQEDQDKSTTHLTVSGLSSDTLSTTTDDANDVNTSTESSFEEISATTISAQSIAIAELATEANTSNFVLFNNDNNSITTNVTSDT